MLYELSFAAKYLTPRWKQLSVSIISLISIGVIAAVVWLIVVFFSVANGLTNNWVDKLIALTAPVRITPTKHYYHSYYYLVDSISSNSDYALKSIAEKRHTESSDPYDPYLDEELPDSWTAADKLEDGTLRDPVKLAFEAIEMLQKFEGVVTSDFETTVANLELGLPTSDKEQGQWLSQLSYVGGLDAYNPWLSKAILPLTSEEFTTLQDSLEEEAWLSITSFHDLVKALSHQENASSALALPTSATLGEGILLPKSYKETGVTIGSQGHLSYQSTSATGMQEQQLPFFVVGFYDPGIMPMGNKYLIASREVTSQIRSSYPPDDNPLSNGINVRLAQRDDADAIKGALLEAFDQRKIGPYWKIESYRDYEFSRDIIQQLQSEKRLFTLLATIIIIVACSNIVSMLIILVNDKKVEIGILRSMGASATSIATIFGLCGVAMGLIGSAIGIAAATLTIKNIQPIVDTIGRIQGYEMFNRQFYGETLPSDLSLEALSFVIAATVVISLLAGIIPAVKACLLKPSAILKTE